MNIPNLIKIEDISSIPHVRIMFRSLIKALDDFVPDSAVQSDSIKNIVVLTQAEYDALTTKDSNTEYNIVES